MDFADQIKELAEKINNIKEHVLTEEATKQSLVLPLLQVLGYNIFDPTEVMPEFTADIGIKKGEKVDYVIFFNKEPNILIEVKTVKTNLQPNNAHQLLRYFGVTKANFAILTNGIEYQFFTDLEKKNVMDTIPFLTLNIIPSIRDHEIAELKRFHKNHFDSTQILEQAEELKYMGEVKRYLKKQIKEPQDEFIRLIIKNTSYPKSVTKQAIERFSTIFQNAFKQYLNETITDKLKETIERTDKIEEKQSKEDIDNLRLRFWTQLLNYSKTKTDLHSKIRPGKESWCSMGAGESGVSYSYTIQQHQGIVELYIDKGNYDSNKKKFDSLLKEKDNIEKVFGGPLIWDRLDAKKACRIKNVIKIGGYRDEEEKWPQIYGTMVDAMIRLHKAFSPYFPKSTK